MNKIIAAILIASGLLPLGTGGAAAQEIQATLYHVSETTFGCADADSTRALTDPQAPLRWDSDEFRTVFANGHCVTITPRSPWTVMARDGDDVALMSYAGTVGQPGTYYMKIGKLVDPLGRHPAATPGAAAAQRPAAVPVPAQPGAGAAAGDQSATALAPLSQGTMAPAPSASPAPLSGQPAEAGGTTSFWAQVGWGLLAVALVASGILIVWRPRWGRSRRTIYKLSLPDHVMRDAARLADESGATLDNFLVTLIAERIGQLKATGRPAPAAKQVAF